jgi:hypothetical protein
VKREVVRAATMARRATRGTSMAAETLLAHGWTVVSMKEDWSAVFASA